MFALEHHIRKTVFAEFATGINGEAVKYIGTGRVPTVFPNETLAHEARNDFGLDKNFNVVKLVVEE